MWMPLTALALSAPLVLTAAEQVPTLNVEPSCRAVADGHSPIRRDFNSCMDSENRARADVVKEWDQFKAAYKTHCVQLSTLGGVPSYTELLTCLEMERDAAQLKERGGASTTGSGGGAAADIPARNLPTGNSPAKR
jgi:hypothetical protein